MTDIITSLETQIKGCRVHMSFRSEDNPAALSAVTGILSSFAGAYLDNRTEDNAALPAVRFRNERNGG